MEHNLVFGGGVSATTMTPVVILAVLAGAIAIVLTNRKTALAIALPLVFLIPSTQQLYVLDVHLYVWRILAIAGIVRLIKSKLSSTEPVFPSKFGAIDALFLLWAFWKGTALTLDYKTTGVVIQEVAFWIDAVGGYLLFRHLIRNRQDVIWVAKVFAVIVSFLAACMSYEYLTRVNVFSYISAHPIVPWIRDGKFRAQGSFANSITAGVFGAVLAPLFYWLWRFKEAKTLGLIAMIASAVMVVTSLASTAALAFAGGAMAVALWPARAHLRKMRWGLVAVITGLALVMKAPVWYLIARADVVGGSNGWDRANLINETVQHFSSWWLVGTQARATWGFDTWDACNQFVLEATDGGLFTLLLFIALLAWLFTLVGRARKRASSDRKLTWFYWCLGAALFANLMAFMGVDYFDQTFVEWLVFLAMISAVTQRYLAQPAASPARAPAPKPTRKPKMSPAPATLRSRNKLNPQPERRRFTSS